ncbi:MAG: oxaloacetate decarboxylase [Bacteroidota bacterium]
MDQVFQTAFEIFGVGMVTIFAILALVVLTGQTLIRLVNRISKPEPVPEEKIPEAHIAAIHAAVEVVTQGRGKVQSISSPS